MRPKPLLPSQRALSLVALLAVFAAAGSALGEISDAQKTKLINAVGDRLERSAFAFHVDFSDWPQHVRAHRGAIKAATTKRELSDALRKALGEFELSHLSIRSPEEVKLGHRGKRIGIGITFVRFEDHLLATHVLKQSPAWKAGIRAGDKLTHLDGAPIAPTTDLSGHIGTQRRFAWTPSAGGPRQSEIAYAAVPLADKSSLEWPSEDIAWLRVHSFQFRFYQINRINRFIREARKAKAIVIDLRSNAGGLALFSRHLASKISKRSAVFSLKVNKKRYQKFNGAQFHEEDILRYAKKRRPLPLSLAKPYEGPVFVLVDQNSASAADIFTAFVQESARGTAIGTRTAGALQLARTFRLPLGFQLYLPTAEILTPSGLRLEQDGLLPEILLDAELTTDDERILQIVRERIAP